MHLHSDDVTALRRHTGLDDEMFSLCTQIEDFDLALVSRIRHRLGKLRRRQTDKGVCLQHSVLLS